MHEKCGYRKAAGCPVCAACEQCAKAAKQALLGGSVGGCTGTVIGSAVNNPCIGALIGAMSGCCVESSAPTGGMTLPSGHYLQHRPQYFPPTPPFPLKRELATMEAAPSMPIPPPPVPPPGLGMPMPPFGFAQFMGMHTAPMPPAPWTVKHGADGVTISGEDVEGTCDSVTFQGPGYASLDGHVHLKVAHEGHDAEVTADHVRVRLADMVIEIGGFDPTKVYAPLPACPH